MAKITALRIGRNRSKRINISLDDKFTFSVESEVVAREGLQIGQTLSPDQIEALARSDRHQRCLNAAVNYLSYRPRSELELRQRLRQRGFTSNNIGGVVTELKRQGLVDDLAFAQFWRDNRQSFNPRSQWLTKLELRRKGIADNTIKQVINTIDDDDSAYRAAKSKIRSLPLSDYQNFRQRLGGYLKRRGFGYEVVNHIVEQIWQEVKEGD